MLTQLNQTILSKKSGQNKNQMLQENIQPFTPMQRMIGSAVRRSQMSAENLFNFKPKSLIKASEARAIVEKNFLRQSQALKDSRKGLVVLGQHQQIIQPPKVVITQRMKVVQEPRKWPPGTEDIYDEIFTGNLFHNNMIRVRTAVVAPCALSKQRAPKMMR